MGFDFESDMKLGIVQDLSDFNIKASISKDIHELLVDYFTILKKAIPPIKRAVKINPDFKKKIKQHNKCDEIYTIKEFFETGKNVNKFQSKKLFQTKFHDHLAYEWNIYHFHLSTEQDTKTNFVKQVKQLLFVYISKSEAIFLDTDNHSKGVFGDSKWIKILHNHFPYTIKENKVDDIFDITPNLTPIGRQTFWDKGYSAGLIKINNSFYLGGGKVTSGHSIMVSMTMINVMRWINKINIQFDTFYSVLCKTIGVDENKAEFRLGVYFGAFQIHELKTKTHIVNFPYEIDENKLINSSIPS